VKQDQLLSQLVELIAVAPEGLTSETQRAHLPEHVADAIAGAALCVDEPPGPLVDVGSGGGFPGLVLAIVLADRPVTLVEANTRKAAFLVRAAKTLGLDHVTVASCRSETHLRDHRERFAVATARALAPPTVACELCLPYVRLGGLFVLYAGLVPDALPRVCGLLGGAVERVVAVAGMRQRHLVVVRKVAATPDRFPRRPGVAAKRPLERFT
jgi:16S rRNA (guanine527-N7)-methyltransferase